MAYVQSILSPDPIYLQPKSYSAQSDRKPFADILSPGVVGSGDFAVSLTTLLGISIAAGSAWILGQNIADQGLYRQYVSGATTLTCTAANGSNPRLDQVILRVLDNAADSGTFNECRIEIVPGTPTAGATLDNRTGAANLATLTDASKSVLLIADILVPTGATSLSGANLRDRRVRAAVGGGLAVVQFPAGALLPFAGSAAPVGFLMADGASYTTVQYAILFAAIGYTYGGSGANFNVPDGRGRALIGAGQGAGLTNRALGAKMGEENHQLVAAELAAHHHTGPSHTHGFNLGAGNDFIYNSGAAGVLLGSGGSMVFDHANSVHAGTSDAAGTGNTGDTGSGTPHNVMQPSIAFNYIIKT